MSAEPSWPYPALDHPTRPRLLYSYAYIRRNEAILDGLCRLGHATDVMIDSGAFTSFQDRKKAALKGAAYQPITLDEYVPVCRRLDGNVWGYIQLDVIQDVVGTRDNLEAMLEAGLSPIPVFVIGEAYERMAELVAISPRVCVAGGVTGTTYAQARFQHAYEASGKQAQIHALGFARIPAVYQLPLASGDSSAYSSGSRFGTIAVPDRVKQILYAPRKHVVAAAKRDAGWEQAVGWLRRCGVPTAAITDPEAYKSLAGIGSLISIFAAMVAAEAMAQRGFRFFFATATPRWIGTIIAVAACRAPDGTFSIPDSQVLSAELTDQSKADPTAYYERLARLLEAC